MANVTVTFTITEFCLHTGVSEEELNEIVGLGVVEPSDYESTTWLFDDHAVTVVQRALRLRQELALDWPGIAVALTLLEENTQLRQENRLLRQRLSRFMPVYKSIKIFPMVTINEQMCSGERISSLNLLSNTE